MTDAVADAGSGAGGRKRLIAQLTTVVGLVIGVAACVFVGNELRSEWSRVEDSIRDASPAWMFVALVLCSAGMTFIGWGWTDVLRVLGVRVDRLRVIAWYFVGELGKYVPGGVWPVLGRGELARRGGVAGPVAYASTALSLATLYLGGMLVAVVLLPFALGEQGPGAVAAVLALLPFGLAALHPRVLNPLLGLARRLTGRELAMEIPEWHDSVAVVVRYVPAWVANAAGTVAVAHAVAPGESGVARIAFAALLSWVAGLLAVPVPAGAGVRETVFIATSGLPTELGATVAVGARVLFIVADVLGAAWGAAYLRRVAKRGPVLGHAPGEPAPDDVPLDP